VASRRSRRSTEEIRTLILEAAAEEFSSAGYGEVTLHAVATRAGISLSVLHRHFATKELLFSEALAAPFLQFFGEFAAAWRAPAEDSDDVERLVRAFVGRLYETLSRERRTLVGLLAISQSSDDATLAALRATVDQVRRGMREIAEQNAELYGPLLSTPELTNRFIASLVTGLILLHPLFSSGAADEDETLIAEATRFALFGYRAVDAATLEPPGRP
jgi:AcrR family transcriptional regulator